MKAFLMHRNHDFDIEQKLPFNEEALLKDLELNTLLNTMALEDEFIYSAVKQGVLSSLKDSDSILYRQSILKDCLKNSSTIMDMYDVATEAVNSERKFYYGIFSDYPDSILDRSVEVLQMFVEMLKKLKNIINQYENEFYSDGFITFFKMINKELNDEYFSIIQNHLKELKFNKGVLISAELGKGNKGVNYIIRRQNDKKQSLLKKIIDMNMMRYTYYISDRDESGTRALSELRNRGIASIANAVAQSTEHILSFFKMLRVELAFYVGCLNLYNKLQEKGVQICFPVPVSAKEIKYSFTGLYDVCLCLSIEQRPISNSTYANGKNLMIITGANQGGKSTFLRSLGLAQLMMQCGIFVPAQEFCSSICSGIFTHFKREEDVTMKSGKLDEELSRMSQIIDNISRDSMILFNESFSATNEREGSEIARQIICALLEKNIRVMFVTHFYELAHGFYKRNMKNAIFLKAERKNSGDRTFKIIEGEPLETSYGADIYKKVFMSEV